MSNDSIEQIPGGFVRPFRWDGWAFFWDANNKMAADYDEEDKPRPRGWGRIQYLDNGDAAMDAWEAWFGAVVGAATDADEVVRQLNGVSDV